jgi:hypothetical protein
MKYWILAFLSGGLCLVNVWHSYHDVQNFGGTDLRARVVGARALVRGINPYSIKDTTDLDPALRDPDQSGLSRCTYPLTLLCFYAPLSSLTYPTQRVIWAVLEWSAFLASVLVLSACIRSQQAKYWFFVAAVGLFGSSFFWRLHVERGQYYVFIVLLISIGMLLLLKTQHAVASGIFWGLAICLRPTVGLLVVPWLMSSQRRTAITAIATAVISVTIATIVGRPEYWLDFLGLSQAWEQSVLGAEPPDTVFESAISGPTDGYNTAMLENYAANLTFDSLALSVQTMVNVRLDPRNVARAGKVLWLFVIATIWILQWKRKRGRMVPVADQILVGSCMMLVTDYFLPIRIEYADVLFLIPMALLMPSIIRKENHLLAAVFVIAMLIPLAPLSILPFNASAPAAMLRSCMAIYLLVRFALLGLQHEDSDKIPDNIIHAHASRN